MTVGGDNELRYFISFTLHLLRITCRRQEVHSIVLCKIVKFLLIAVCLSVSRYVLFFLRASKLCCINEKVNVIFSLYFCDFFFFFPCLWRFYFFGNDQSTEKKRKYETKVFH